MVEQTGSTPLFAVFIIAIYSLLLIGYTCYKLCAAASPDEVVKPWEAVSFSLPGAQVKLVRQLQMTRRPAAFPT